MITNTISNWVANSIFVAKNQRFTYDGREWMPALFDTPSRTRIWKMSRQVGKTTGGVAESTCHLCLREGFRILYVAPERDQASKYHHDKLKPIIEESPIVKTQRGEPNNVFEVGFKKKGKIYLKYAKHNPDSCRGLTVDMVHYDEIQDQDLDETEPVIRETMFTSDYKLSLYTGTPKSMVNPIEKKWQASDQREWVIRCPHHTPNKWMRLGIRNIGQHGPICHHCGNQLNVSNGQWVITNPGAKMAGFHVNQLNCKISHRSQADWDEILDKYENTERALFLNEVLGESADTAEVPITEQMMRNVCDKDYKMSESPPPGVMRYQNFAGIDWGHGQYATSFVIGQMDQKTKKFRYIYMRKFEGKECAPSYCLPEIVKMVKKYQVVRVHCDFGGGYALNEQLNDLLADINKPDLVTANYWSNSAVASDATWSMNHDVPRLTLNKSKAFAAFINKLWKRRVIFPRWQDFAPFLEHFTNVRKEHDEKKDYIRYDRAGPDDTFHACVYAEVIARAYFAQGY